MRFLFRLDLSLHAGTGKKFGILIFETKHGAKRSKHSNTPWGLVDWPRGSVQHPAGQAASSFVTDA